MVPKFLSIQARWLVGILWGNPPPEDLSTRDRRRLVQQEHEFSKLYTTIDSDPGADQPSAQTMQKQWFLKSWRDAKKTGNVDDAIASVE